MENASKALLMAAGVLIGILILSLAVYLFASFGTTSAELHKQKQEGLINQFNSQFVAYEGKDDVTIYDVITVANLATENNIYYEFAKRNSLTEGKDNYISVQFKNNDISKYDGKYIEKGFDSDIKSTRTEYNELISLDLALMNISSEQDNSDLNKYNCKVEISSTTERVYKVVFTKK